MRDHRLVVAARHRPHDARGEVVTIVRADVDGLKRINDRNGHAAGDRAICAACALLRRAARTVRHVVVRRRQPSGRASLATARRADLAMDAAKARRARRGGSTS
ncbi:MAG TPA: diguanylate cyclase [Candidatus Dormibacteraeota bacterium]|nr:diguanylate cyclase [Candidatus Dormibacteraeota bacterium]